MVKFDVRRSLPFVLSGSIVLAQQFDELRPRSLPSPRDATKCLVLADLDGDGDVDLVCGGSNRFYRNRGDGIFDDDTAASLPPGLGEAMAIACGDFDGDHDLDLLLAVGSLAGGQDRLLRNDGSGHFTDITATNLPVDSDFTMSVACGDLDGDGDLDLVFGNDSLWSEPCRVYANDGTGNFSNVTVASLGSVPVLASSVVLDDVDGDGDLDLLTNDPVRLFRNTGGVFTDVSSTHVPPGTNALRLVPVDFDGDGDRDLYCPGWPATRLLRNVGGVFVDVTATQLPAGLRSSWAALAIDVDGDGDLDVVEGARVLRNNGGVFTLTPVVPLATGETVLSIAGGDVDNDGDADLVLAAREFLDGHDHLLLGDGTGAFTDVSPARIAPGMSAEIVAVGDFDGDGDVDVTMHGAVSRLWRNDGSGWFSEVVMPAVPPRPGWAAAVAALDVDGDGDLDLVVAGSAQCDLLRNDGSGNFTVAPRDWLPRPLLGATSLVSGDFDGDGDVDLVYGGAWYAPILLANRGNGRFVVAPRFPLLTPYLTQQALAVGDVDGDGWLDVVASNPSRKWLYRNLGNGFFVDASANLPADVDDTRALALADFDGDGDLDLFCGNSWSMAAMGSQHRLYWNDGSGVFSDGTSDALPENVLAAMSVVAGDVDGDGDVDVLFSGPCPGCPAQRCYRNDGAGRFTDATATQWPGQSSGGALQLVDLDRDGDLDIVDCSAMARTVFLNLTRQLHAPFPARVGRPFVLEVWQRGAPATGLAVVFLSTAKLGGVPTPLGVLGIAPMLALPPTVVPAPDGVGSAQFVVPAVPALVGVPLYAQALLVSPPAPARLTNITTNVILQ